MARRKPLAPLLVVYPSRWKNEPKPRNPNTVLVFAQYEVTPAPAPAVVYSEARQAAAHRKHQDELAMGHARNRPSYILEVAGVRRTFATLGLAVKAYVAAASALPKLFHVLPSGETQVA